MTLIMLRVDGLLELKLFLLLLSLLELHIDVFQCVCHLSKSHDSLRRILAYFGRVLGLFLGFKYGLHGLATRKHRQRTASFNVEVFR